MTVLDDDRRAAGLTENLASLSFIGAALRRRARLWCAVALAGLLAGAGASLAFPIAPQASTSVLLAVSPNESLADQVVTDLALAQSRPVAEKAMDELGLSENLDRFQAAYSVTEVTDRLLLFTVGAPSSSQAVLRARVLAEQFLKFRARELQLQQGIAVATLHRQIAEASRQVAVLATQLSHWQTQPRSRNERAAVISLRTQHKQALTTLTGLEQAETGYPVLTASAVDGSQVVDPAAPVHQSRKRAAAIYGGMGLVAGLALGAGLIIVLALSSERLRRRGDIAAALGGRVGLSLGRGARRGGPRLTAGLREVLDTRVLDAPAGDDRRPAGLAVVCVDNARTVAESLVRLAGSCAAEGRRVVVADLVPGAPAARLLGVAEQGVSTASLEGAQLRVAVPGPAQVAPPGPLGPAGRSGEGLAAGCASADLLLTLASIDPAVGAEHLTTWAADAVAVVTAGRSPAARLVAVGEALRLAGARIAPAILLGADPRDESLGVASTVAVRRRPAPRLGAVGR